MKTKVILEIGCNHNGDIETAKKMIGEAANLGVWAVKFQKRDIEGMHEGWKLLKRDLSNSFAENYYDHRKALEFSIEQIEELLKFAKTKGLVFGVTAFDVESIHQLKQMPVDYIKLPSQSFTDYSMCRELFETPGAGRWHGSVGMHTIEEVLNWQYKSDFDVIYYCRSIYPCPLDELHYSQILLLSSTLKITQELGYSSHDIEGHGIFGAVLMGAKYIERHFTLDKNMKGHDHKTVSSDIKEMKIILQSIEYAESMLGNDSVSYLPEKEKEIRKKYRGF